VKIQFGVSTCVTQHSRYYRASSSQENHGIQFLWHPGTLPADYPLEQAVPEPVITVYDEKSDGCSTESVRMFSDTPKQLTCEEKHENLQAPKCFHKATFSPERPIFGIIGIFSLTNEQKPENELCGKHVKPQRVNNAIMSCTPANLIQQRRYSLRSEISVGNFVLAKYKVCTKSPTDKGIVDRAR
jgi:hypothetical protein